MLAPRRRPVVRSAVVLRCAATLALVFCAAVSSRAALSPKELLLVVNTRIPASRALAESYARQRHIPDGRIVEIDVAPGAWPTRPKRSLLTLTSLPSPNQSEILSTARGWPARSSASSRSTASRSASAGDN